MKILGILVLGFISLFFSSNDSMLVQIEKAGELRVAINEGITTYYKRPDGQPTGIEYELSKYFARELGVRLKIIKTNSNVTTLNQIIDNKVHFAAGLTVKNQPKVRFTPHYQNINQQLVYHDDRKSPNSFNELNYEHKLHVTAEHAEIFKSLQTKYPKLAWQEMSNTTPYELAKKIINKEIKYAAFNSNELTRIRLIHPELKTSFSFPQQQHLAWAFPQSDDNSLYFAAIQFLNKIKQNGELQQLIENYYGYTNNTKNFSPLGIKKFLRHIDKRLPLYQEQFQFIADQYNLDWRLLAAISYQESKWDPKAVSYTGVKGLMMLTKLTAEEMGIEDRTNPFESIQGGTKYFVTLKRRISEQISETDRIWLALAAYNVGIGHISDVRKITASHGDDPNRWRDVKKHLPKLTQPRWYKKTRYGYARGHEPVEFVENIRMFYDILVMNIV
ncbi:membrane-bound lytic murein transglycosylase MltF [Candidatus Halobeggiatoa sp. HSG11]|nr:membrane-bound lytic murein transglycosylase MltF [Candidatus Halobeggiatoa sp. HSG11]